MIQKKWAERKMVCVGLDSDLQKVPKTYKEAWDNGEISLALFNLNIVMATKDLVCAYKPNIAFYESLGINGLMALKATVDYIKLEAPDVPIIGDMKLGDIGSTNLGHIKEAFEWFGFDAITVHPYLGREAMQPFLDMKNKGIFVLCRTSNKGSDEFQDVEVVVGSIYVPRYMPYYQYVASRVANNWNENGNCGLVVGATYPEALTQVRAIVGDNMPILVPGIGAQGGDLEKTIKAGKKNMIISVSRSIIFASSGSDFAEAARRETIKLQEAINQYL